MHAYILDKYMCNLIEVAGAARGGDGVGGEDVSR